MLINKEIIEKAKKRADFGKGEVFYYSLKSLEEAGVAVDKLPFSIRVLLENVLRNYDGKIITEADLNAYANWPTGTGEIDVPYLPSRVILQDFTGVPLLVDLADMREAMQEQGADPALINPKVPTDLVIDHSIQVDYYASPEAFNLNLDMEYKRNIERYKLIKWAQGSFKNMRVVPPGSGIVHQVNLEYLSPVVDIRDVNGERTAVIDTIVGTDSHTPMINGLGVLGWGVGGIEAEANMLGQPYYLLQPEVIGIKLVGSLPEGATATDLVLSITELLRKKGVVGKFIEYFGPGLANLTVPDRATISNMSPEHGCTLSYFPVDEATLDYLRLTGRDPEHITFIENYLKEQKLFRTPETPDPTYSEVIEFDLSKVVPSLSGPRNPEERVNLPALKERVENHIAEYVPDKQYRKVQFELNGETIELKDGDLVIAAITSCTNTSNPSVMVGAGLLAKKAVEKGLTVKPYVKTSLAPGSTVVTEYYKALGLMPYLEKLGFHLVGYGCTSCIGNSGPLKQEIEKVIQESDLYVSAVLSGNRNFPGRVHPLTRGNFLASPMLVVAFALAGTTLIDLDHEPLGTDSEGNPVFLKDIWPSHQEIREAIEKGVTAEIFKQQYQNIMTGDAVWQDIQASTSLIFEWDPESTYIRRPPYFKDFKPGPRPITDVQNARVLVMASEKVSTDHISPAGTIPKDSPAGKYLLEHGVPPEFFNTYGSRRGNHEVMMRGTFANVRLRNQLVPGREGWWTTHYPTGDVIPIFDAAMRYKEEGVPLLVLGAEQYGQGSSRDWAAKGPMLQGVRVVIAKAFERIHRSNLIGMGVLPLQFEEGQGWKELGIEGNETFEIQGMTKLEPKSRVSVVATKPNGYKIEFSAIVRLDAPIELDYYRYGGILPYVASQLLQ